jgi:hypothetical protein
VEPQPRRKGFKRFGEGKDLVLLTRCWSEKSCHLRWQKPSGRVVGAEPAIAEQRQKLCRDWVYDETLLRGVKEGLVSGEVPW